MQPEQRIDPDAIKAWRLSGLISASIYAAVVVTLAVFTSLWSWPVWIATAAFALATIAAALEIAWYPVARWRRFRYEIREEEIDIVHGLLVRKRTLIPMAKVQHVDTKQGPIYRRYGLAAVTFATAAGSHEIPALTEMQADSVRNRIARLARIVDDER